MLLLLFSLISYGVINCNNETNRKEKFNESSLLKQYRNHFLEVQAFIKDVEHKFHANETGKRGGHETYRLSRHREVYGPLNGVSMMGKLGLNSQQTKFVTSIRSRPIFPGSITPYTTEFNSQHLKWDKIFPLSTVHIKPNISKWRFRPLVPPPPATPELSSYEVSSYELSPPEPFSPKPSAPEPSPPELSPELSSPELSYPEPSPEPFSLKSFPPKPASPKTASPKPAFHKTASYNPAYPKPSKSTGISLEANYGLLYTTSASPTFFLWNVRSTTTKGTTLASLKSINTEAMHLWLQEITTYSPIEEWMQTMRSTCNDYTTRRIPKAARTPSKAKIPVRKKTLQDFFRNRLRYIKRPGLRSLPGKPLNAEDLEHSTARIHITVSESKVVSEKLDVYVPVTAKFIVDKSGITLRTTLEKNADIRTTVFGERPDDVNVPVTTWFIEDKNRIPLSTALEKNADIKTIVVGQRPEAVNILVTETTAGDRFYKKEQNSDSSDKTRRFHPKVRRRQHNHHSYKPNRERQRYRYPDSFEDTYRIKDQEMEYPMMRRMKDTIEDRKKNSTDKTKRKRTRQKTGILLSDLVARSTDSRQQGEAVHFSNELSQVHLSEPEDEIRIKHIGRRDESRHKRVQKRAKKEKLFKELKDRLKVAESRKKVKQMMLKADLIRKIVEGSSYSDEEESLKKNLIQALKYKDRT